MTVRCPSCGVALRVNRERLGGRSSAACPKCQATIELTPSQADAAEAGKAITVVCASCSARLKAPASRAGSKSRCPRCRSEVTIGGPGGHPARPAAEETETAGVATRRIDSRTLGLELGATAAPPLASSDIDLEEFIKGMPAATPAEGPGKEDGVAASLMKPPVGAMTDAAHKIRAAAQEMAEPVRAHAGPVAPSTRKAVAEAGATKTTSVPSEPIALATTATASPRSSKPPSTASVAKDGAQSPPFPMSRGILAGAVAGLLICGVSLLLKPSLDARNLAWLLAPLPSTAAVLGLPAEAVRALLVAVLAALAGLIAAGTGSPTSSDRPLRFARCAAAGVLTGAAAGTLVAMDPTAESTTFSMWPVVNWMRDLLLVGLLTPALNRLLPRREA